MDGRHGVARTPLGISCIYLAFGVAWLLLAELAASSLLSDRSGLPFWLPREGWLFLIASTLLIFLLLRRALRAGGCPEPLIERYRSLYDHNPDAIYSLDLDGHFTEVNDAACRLTGLPRERLVGMHYSRTVAEASHEHAEQTFASLAAGEPARMEMTAVRADGTEFDCRVAATPIVVNGSVVGIHGVAREITEERRARERVELASRALDNAAEAIMILGPDTRVLQVNRAYERITGYTGEEMRGRLPGEQMEQQQPGVFDDLRRSLTEKGHWQGELWNLHKSGQSFPALYTVSAVPDEQGEAAYYVAAFSDISSLKQYEARLEHLAHHDPLTGLPNRTLAADRGNEAVRRARRHREPMGVLFLDLDQFKRINDSLGHSTGDRLLVAAAQRLGRCVRDTDTVARLGGDEFAVVLDELAHTQDAGIVAEKILAAFHDPFDIEGQSLYTSASIGIACFPDDGGDFESLLRSADSAMFRAKALGRKGYQFTSAELNVRARRALHLHNYLHEALDRDEFTLHFQPMVELGTGRMTGAEALLRWDNPRLGLVSPAEFIPLAEESGLMVPIGEWVLERACGFAREVLQRGRGNFRVSVNLSATQFRRPQLADSVAGALRRSDLPAAALQLEVTETAAMDDAVNAVAVLEELHRIGIPLALDDFGTGYSSLAYLRDFRVDYLKLDKGFIQRMADNRDDAAIVQSMLSVANDLRIRAIAEGVETREQQTLLQGMGCGEAQGYFFSMPLTRGDLLWLLDRHDRLPPR